MDFISDGTMLDNIFLLFRAYEWYEHLTKKELKKRAKEQDIPEFPESEPDDEYVEPFEPPRSDLIKIPVPSHWRHWRFIKRMEETPEDTPPSSYDENSFELPSSRDDEIFHMELSFSEYLVNSHEKPPSSKHYVTSPEDSVYSYDYSTEYSPSSNYYENSHENTPSFMYYEKSYEDSYPDDDSV
uniref:Uncharacterized protein n=1 Tax=Cacopsylla melanoneura TaxID=428564 RepID=A0A8D8X657_9HEMI